MPIPKNIKIAQSPLPDQSGVYLMRNNKRSIIYIGKATSLKSRVSSYFYKAHDSKTARLVADIRSIAYIITGSILEATLLEAELIKHHQPKYNIKEKDDRSWMYLCLTKDTYPKLLMLRGMDLNHNYNSSDFSHIFGPYQSKKVLTSILSIVRKIFPWSNCQPNANQPCFYYHLGQCPGICAGTITPTEYKKTIRRLILLFRGQVSRLLQTLERDMNRSATKQDFATAIRLRNQINKLRYVQDIALLSRPDQILPTSLAGRIEGYDISNISGTSAVGSMVVFIGGEPDKSAYRKFLIRSVERLDDTAMLRDILTRRFKRNWPYPNLLLIDGGRGQVSSAKRVLSELKISLPVFGIAKGPTRQKNEFIFGFLNSKLQQEILTNQNLLIRVRDEAHRFAISFHRSRRSRQSGLHPKTKTKPSPQ